MNMTLDIMDWFIIIGALVFVVFGIRTIFSKPGDPIDLSRELEKTKAALVLANSTLDTETAKVRRLTKEMEANQEKQLQAFFNLMFTLNSMSARMVNESITNDGYCTELMLWMKIYTFNYMNFYHKESKLDKEFDRNIKRTAEHLDKELKRIYGGHGVKVPDMGLKTEAILKEIVLYGESTKPGVIYPRKKD